MFLRLKQFATDQHTITENLLKNMRDFNIEYIKSVGECTYCLHPSRCITYLYCIILPKTLPSSSNERESFPEILENSRPDNFP